MSKPVGLTKGLAVSAFAVAMALAPAGAFAYGTSGSSDKTMGTHNGKEMSKEMHAKPMDDAGLAAKVKEGLMADPEMKGMDIKVEAMQGTVKLTGMVDTAAQKDKAMEMVKKMEGVKEVKDGLTVKGETATK